MSSSTSSSYMPKMPTIFSVSENVRHRRMGDARLYAAEFLEALSLELRSRHRRESVAGEHRSGTRASARSRMSGHLPCHPPSKISGPLGTAPFSRTRAVLGRERSAAAVADLQASRWSYRYGIKYGTGQRFHLISMIFMVLHYSFGGCDESPLGERGRKRLMNSPAASVIVRYRARPSRR